MKQLEDASAIEEARWAAEERRRMLAEKAEERREHRIAQSGLPPSLRGIEIPDGPVGRLAGEWAEGKLNGLCLTGGVGVGKTYTAAAACWARLQREGCRWVSVARLMTQMRAGFEDESRKHATAAIIKPTAVVLDDLDKVNPTEFGKEVIFAAVDGRVEAGAPLLVTTNLSPTEIGKKLGEPVMSRVAGYCEVVRMAGVDRRVSA